MRLGRTPAVLLGLLGLFSHALAQAEPRIVADDTGITVSVPRGSKLFVRVGDNPAQEVVTRSDFDALRSQLEQLAVTVAAIPDTAATLAGLRTDVDAADIRIGTLETTTAPPTTAPPLPPTSSPTLDCDHGHNSSGGCLQWVPVQINDIADIVTYNTHVSVDIVGGAVAIASRAAARGCGNAENPHSSMGVYFRGSWTKIRYQQRFRGTSSCYSIFGSTRYNAHEHNDVSDMRGGQESVSGERLSLGDEMGGLFEFDRAVDALSDPYMVTDVAFNRINRTNAGSWCAGGDTIWNTNVGEERRLTVELRRFYHEFPGGPRQYAFRAGPSAGVSCAVVGATQWTFDSIYLLK